MRVLVVNTGSSSVKLRLVDGHDELEAATDLALDGSTVDAAQLETALAELGDVDAIGHRVVHGGAEFESAVRLDDDVMHRLAALIPLAPIHQPMALRAAAVARTARPRVPNVACFDTAFHSKLPPTSATYAIPGEWRARWPLRRFGFHGLSHQWAANRAAALAERAPDDPNFRVVTCHLGAGVSLAAVESGRSIDTTMGFTPLEGPMMATRSGTVDPGLLLWLLDDAGLAINVVKEALERHSGLVALSGTSDMRQAITRADAGDREAGLAVDVYVHSLCRHVGAMAASLGGLDALVFTGGVGENAPSVRFAVAARFAFTGVVVDPECNQHAVPDCEVSGPGAMVRTFVIASREDIQIAREVRALLGS